jgi:hypothetical protein
VYSCSFEENIAAAAEIYPFVPSPEQTPSASKAEQTIQVAYNILDTHNLAQRRIYNIKSKGLPAYVIKGRRGLALMNASADLVTEVGGEKLEKQNGAIKYRYRHVMRRVMIGMSAFEIDSDPIEEADLPLLGQFSEVDSELWKCAITPIPNRLANWMSLSGFDSGGLPSVWHVQIAVNGKAYGRERET